MKFLVCVVFVVCVIVSNVEGFVNKCKSSNDCEEGECCVNYAIVLLFGGHCHKMRLEGESCTPIIKESVENPNMYHFQCPCKDGLKCVAKYEIKVVDHIIKHQPECVLPEEDTPETTPFPEPTPA